MALQFSSRQKAKRRLIPEGINIHGKWILALVVVINLASLSFNALLSQKFFQGTFYPNENQPSDIKSGGEKAAPRAHQDSLSDGTSQGRHSNVTSDQQTASLKSPQIFYSSNASSQNGQSDASSSVSSKNKTISSPKPVTLQARRIYSSRNKPNYARVRQTPPPPEPPYPPPLLNGTKGTGPLYEVGPWDVSPVIIEEYKLMFFTIPKTGTTVFKQLLRRMMGIKDWHVQQDPWIPHEPRKNGLKYLYHYSAEQGEEFLTSPDWTRAIFVRDPKQRVLSAYMDKVLRGNANFVRDHCCGITLKNQTGASNTDEKCRPLAPFSKKITEKELSFELFVKKFISTCDDTHWRPQAKRMPDDAWKHINFVGDFSDLKGGSRKLLDRLGGDAWEKFGAHDWPGGGGAIFETNTMTHKTSSANYIDKVFTPELEELVYSFYREDYEHPVMNFTKTPSITFQNRHSDASSPVAFNTTMSNKVFPSQLLAVDARRIPSSPSKPNYSQVRRPPPSPRRTRGTGPLYERGPWDVSPVIVEKYKLMFFTIPKTGTTVFKQLLRRMMVIKDWHIQQDPWIPHDPGKNGLKYLYHYSAEQGKEFMTSPDWTRAIFVRDPKQRVLSAYMDKALGGNANFVRDHCCGITIKHQNGTSNTDEKCRPLAPFSKNITKEDFPFELFVKKFISTCDDTHWRPQAKRMPNDVWEHINFVGDFSRLKEDSRKMLERLGDDVWEKFGAHDWPGGAIFETNTMTHKTSSADYIDKVFTPELEELVYSFYREDYEHPVMNFTKPPVWQPS